MMRLLALINNIDPNNHSSLVIDARTITQLIYIYSVIGAKFSKKNTTLLWGGSQSDLILVSKFIDVPQNCHILEIDLQDNALIFNFKNLRVIKNICKSLSKSSDRIQLFTSFASGMYFEILKSSLCVDNDDVIQFDDGIINEFIVRNRYRFFRFLIYLLHGFICLPSKYRMFSDNRFKKIYTSINPRNIVSIETKLIVDISKDVSLILNQISLNHISIDRSKSAVFMTSPSVESGRMSISDYHKLIKDVNLKLKELGVENVYHSKHPAESHSNDEFYNSIDFVETYKDFPSELLVANKSIAYIVNPLNSTIMMSDYFKHLNEIDTVISYYPKNSPYKYQRIKMIDKILFKHNIEHYVL